MPARIHRIDRIIRYIHIAIQLNRIIEIDGIRILRQEPPQRGVVVSCPQAILACQRIELLPGVLIWVSRCSRSAKTLPKGGIGIRICDCP